MMAHNLKLIYPNWCAPKNVKAFTTTRIGGVSHAPFDALNLGLHVNDKQNDVIKNRLILQNSANFPSEPFWLNQTHSNQCINIANSLADFINNDADASFTYNNNQVCAILTADCLPALFCSKNGDEVAAAHAGWKGLCAGVLENTVSFFKCKKSDIIVWLGPAIGAKKFEVGQDVKDQFVKINAATTKAFMPISSSSQKYLADIYLLAKLRLASIGISNVFGGNYCTYTQPDLFYSYRRNNQTGRIASCIWFE